MRATIACVGQRTGFGQEAPVARSIGQTFRWPSRSESGHLTGPLKFYTQPVYESAVHVALITRRPASGPHSYHSCPAHTGRRGPTARLCAGCILLRDGCNLADFVIVIIRKQPGIQVANCVTKRPARLCAKQLQSSWLTSIAILSSLPISLGDRIRVQVE